MKRACGRLKQRADELETQGGVGGEDELTIRDKSSGWRTKEGGEKGQKSRAGLGVGEERKREGERRVYGGTGGAGVRVCGSGSGRQRECVRVPMNGNSGNWEGNWRVEGAPQRRFGWFSGGWWLVVGGTREERLRHRLWMEPLPKGLGSSYRIQGRV